MSVLTLHFDANNRLKVQSVGKESRMLEYTVYPNFTATGSFLASVTWQNQDCAIYIVYDEAAQADKQANVDFSYFTWETLETVPKTEELSTLLTELKPYLISIAYMKFNERDYIYRFRNKKERNTEIYLHNAKEIYQSQLCSAIKLIRRTKEKISGDPISLNFGAIEYQLPSHFGFCLGVQNAIERAYESIADFPDSRIFMLSELIHNPFVNADLNQRGLRYLQSDKGEWLSADGQRVTDKSDPGALWNQLKSDDIVIIPAFGATHEDKVRLIKKGITLKAFDATCMLVEKVWKATEEHSHRGYSTIIHGKYYHEETKATFSNAVAHGPALIISDIKEAHLLGQIIRAQGSEKQALFKAHFSGRYSPGFDVNTDLNKIAVVNQTTLLRNLTIEIIEYLKSILVDVYGAEALDNHFWNNEKGDTLCYATQVNQDALVKALDSNLDHSLVIGGKNSSNTYQLYQICQKHLGEKAHYIQSEANILSLEQIEHSVYSKKGTEAAQVRPFVQEHDRLERRPIRMLITGGASCPDGIIQQVICKINALFPAESIRSMDAVLADLYRLAEKRKTD